MKLKLFKICSIVFAGLLVTESLYATNIEEAQKMSIKYRHLAKTYSDLADKIDRELKAQSAQKTQAKPANKIAGVSAQAKISNNSTSEIDNLAVPKDIAEDGTQKTKQPNLSVAAPWKGTNFGLGGSMTTGNSAAINYNANTNIVYKPIMPWNNTLTMSYLYNRDNSGAGSVKTNKFQGLAKTAWNFDKNNGVYGSINYLNDQLDTYKYVLTESIGYQRELFSRNKMTLNATTGPSLTQNKVKSTGEATNAFGWQTGLNYAWNFADASSLTEEILVNYTADNATNYQAKTALSTQLYDNLILQLSFQVNGSSWATSGKRRLGTTTTTSLLYDF